VPKNGVGGRLPPAAPDDPDAGAPEWYRRSRSLRRVPLVAAVVITIIIIRAGQGSPPPELTTSCTTPAFALSTYSIDGHDTVRWAATGPADTRFALAIGVDRFTEAADGHLAPVPDAGVAPGGTRTTAPEELDDDCKADGTFGVVLPAGTYAVRLFTIEGDNAADVQPVVEHTLTVTAG
jgi:hypothetical protein